MRSKVSVIIAAYHGEKYIGEQLKSLFTQTRMPDEILIGDDSDDDATYQAVEAVRPQFSGKLLYNKNKVRLSIISNFENLYRKAEGDLVFFCDQDDVWLPDKIEKMCSYMMKHPRCDILFCDSQCVDSELKNCGYTMFSKYRMSPADINQINSGKAFRLITMRLLPFSGHDIALRKPLEYNVFPFGSELTAYHDQYLSYLTAYMNRLNCLPEPLTLYRRHDGNASDLFDAAQVNRKYDPRDGEIHWLKLDEFSRRMQSLRQLLQSRLEKDYDRMQGNRKYLADLIRFFEKRKRLLSFPPILRSFLLSPRDVIEYFRHCSGIRTIAHDLRCRRIGKTPQKTDS